METLKHSSEAPKTIRISGLIQLLKTQQKQFGDLPIYVTAGKGEAALTDSAARYSDILAFKRKHGNQESLETYQGRFFIISSL